MHANVLSHFVFNTVFHATLISFQTQTLIPRITQDSIPRPGSICAQLFSALGDNLAPSVLAELSVRFGFAAEKGSRTPLGGRKAAGSCKSLANRLKLVSGEIEMEGSRWKQETKGVASQSRWGGFNSTAGAGAGVGRLVSKRAMSPYVPLPPDCSTTQYSKDIFCKRRTISNRVSQTNTAVDRMSISCHLRETWSGLRVLIWLVMVGLFWIR